MRTTKAIHQKHSSRRRSRNTEGSVSIFLIMILAFVFLFAAVLIDFARIAAANTQGERLARAGVRSVMSSYDIALKENYGLFAYGDSDGKMLLSQVLNDSFRKSGRGDEFNLLPLGLESSSLEMSRPLGDYAVFRHQINEEMKYKAPIDFTVELAGKFKPLSSAMGEASRTLDLFSQLQPLYDKREDALDLMLERRSQAAESGRSLLQLIMSSPAMEISSQSIGSLSSAADIVGQYSDYVSKTTADMNLEEGEYPRYASQISDYLQRSSEVITRLQSASISLQESQTKLMNEARDALKEAQILNERMKTILEQARTEEARPGYASAESWDIPGGSDGVSNTAMPNLREQAEGLLLSATDLSNMEAGISSQEHSYQILQQKVSGLPSLLGSTAGLNADISSLETAVLEASRIVNSYIQDYKAGGDIITDEKAAIESHRTSDKERKQTEKQSKVKLRDAMNIIARIRDLGERAYDSMDRYNMLRQYYDENRNFNANLDQDLPVDGESSADPYAAGSAAMDDVDGIYDAMGSVLNGAREHLFQNEYAALYFPHFDVSGLVALTAGGEGDPIQELSDQMDPHQQELEYILYGFYNPAGNVAAAYSEIFAARLAVRTMEGFIEKAALGNPLAVTAAALLYGLEKAIEDMVLLCKKGSLPLSKYVPMQLTYRDYLRIFMLVHGGGEVQLSRMLALIRLNTGVNPAEKFTYASEEIRLGMRLWFLPGVIKALNYTAGLPGDVQKNTYYKEIQADFAY